MSRFILAALAALTLVGLFASATAANADDHDGVECVVAGSTVVDCEDDGIYDEHGENCEVVHYHGDLKGVGDPDEDGCGHGEVTEQPIAAEEDDSGFLNTVYDWFDVAIQGLTTGFSPKSVQESVEIVEDAAPSIAENAQNAEDYFEAYPDAPDRDRYTLEDETEDHGWLYNAFWGLFE
jgi:hypothetical protein